MKNNSWKEFGKEITEIYLYKYRYNDVPISLKMLKIRKHISNLESK